MVGYSSSVQPTLRLRNALAIGGLKKINSNFYLDN